MVVAAEPEETTFDVVESFRPDFHSEVSRRTILRGAALTGAGLIAAACGTRVFPAIGTPRPSPTASLAPTAAPSATATAAATALASATPGATASAGATPSATLGGSIPAGWTQHDVDARNAVRRYLGNLVPALNGIYGPAVYAKLGEILGVADNYPELTQKPAFAQVPQMLLNDVLHPLSPSLDNGVKVFNLTIESINQQIDELKPPIAALGYNGQWPGPTIRVKQGDRVRAVFKNNLDETTSVHFHGVEFDDFFQDGVPFVTQVPIVPGETFTYEFTARNSGSLMYHSHHNATDQVGRGLLAAFLVEPTTPDYKFDREYIWISNDALGGFTINGHGFPATVPVLVAQGETVLIRFMNEGVMMHPWHSHGYAMKVVAKDGIPLGSASFSTDTFGVNPGERWDALITADRLGVWAFHCHILPHVEGSSGMFGMVNTLIVVPTAADVNTIISAVTS